jgi:hypothetical protein
MILEIGLDMAPVRDVYGYEAVITMDIDAGSIVSIVCGAVSIDGFVIESDDMSRVDIDGITVWEG